MSASTIAADHIRPLNNRKVKDGRYILYWMQQAQRAEYNPALIYAVEWANHYKLPVLVAFGLTDRYPEANLRHYTFMLEGLVHTSRALARRGIKLVLRIGPPVASMLDLARAAAAIVCDVGFLKHQRRWRRTLAQKAPCRVVQVAGETVVPVHIVSDKAEYAARTLRPKILRLLPQYLKPVRTATVQNESLTMRLGGETVDNWRKWLPHLKIDQSVLPVSAHFKGGTPQAKNRFRRFVTHHLVHYDRHSNQPQTDDISHMSPYLHFGQISSRYLALTVQRAVDVPDEAKARFLEQLIVRRELACNFVYYTPNYETYACLPAWARQTLTDHHCDPRPTCYTRRQLEAARSHDPYWNAAMQEMKQTGFMHNYMRMYWGKKILQWSTTPADAFNTALYLNNKYFLDGRDPNSYAGVAWLFGLHDRPWPERAIFGKVRYMAASGLERKCDIKAYVAKVRALCASP